MLRYGPIGFAQLAHPNVPRDAGVVVLPSACVKWASAVAHPASLALCFLLVLVPAAFHLL